MLEELLRRKHCFSGRLQRPHRATGGGGFSDFYASHSFKGFLSRVCAPLVRLSPETVSALGGATGPFPGSGLVTRFENVLNSGFVRGQTTKLNRYLTTQSCEATRALAAPGVTPNLKIWTIKRSALARANPFKAATCFSHPARACFTHVCGGGPQALSQAQGCSVALLDRAKLRGDSGTRACL